MWRRLLIHLLLSGLSWVLATDAVAQTTGQDSFEYRLAPGDRVSISVYGEPDLTFDDFPIPSNGIITYPFIGQVVAANLTELELSRRIAQGLQDGYLLQPQVTVAITAYRPVYVGGAVRSPGRKEFSIGMDVERLLALAGGLAEDADPAMIEIQRGGRDALSVSMADSVRPGDVVTVGQRAVTEKKLTYFYMEGEIREPGRYEFSGDLTVQKAIAIAGGFGLRASRRKISINRGQDQLNKVSLDATVFPGDVITVGTSLF